MKNLILVLLALPGWVAAQTDSSKRYIEVVSTEMQLISKCESGSAISSCCAHHSSDKGIQVAPNWCHDHSHCIHQHRHRISEEEQAEACATQCQHHGTYQLEVTKATAKLLDRPLVWPEDPANETWTQTIPMPFPFAVYGREVKMLDIWEDNLTLLDEGERYVMDLYALELDVPNHYGYNYDEADITYQIDGHPGERIMKIQFVGTRRFYGDSIILQLWLHEVNQAVSFHYLKMPVNKKDEHAAISFWAECPNGSHELFIAGLASNPMVRCASQYMCGLPDNGTVYTLKPVHLVLPERKQIAMQHQPFQVKVTPQTGLHQLVGLVGSDELQLFDAQGRLVKRINVAQARQGFLLNEFASGAYLLHDPLYGQSVRLVKP